MFSKYQFQLQSIHGVNSYSLQSEESSDEAPPLTLKNVEGIFWVSVGGSVLALVCVFFELAIHVGKKNMGNSRMFMEELKEELRFYFKFKGTVKPLKDGRADSQSLDSRKSEKDLQGY